MIKGMVIIILVQAAMSQPVEDTPIPKAPVLALPDQAFLKVRIADITESGVQPWDQFNNGNMRVNYAWDITNNRYSEIWRINNETVYYKTITGGVQLEYRAGLCSKDKKKKVPNVIDLLTETYVTPMTVSLGLVQDPFSPTST